MNCKFCGDVVDTDDVICQSCGRTISEPELHYRNDTLEKDDDLKKYYKNASKKQSHKVPKIVAILLIIFMFPLGIIVLLFSDFKKSTIGIILVCTLLVPILFFFLFAVSGVSVTTDSVSFVSEETVAIDVVSIDVDSNVELLRNETDLLLDKVEGALAIIQAVGVNDITEITYVGFNTYSLECGGYEIEIETKYNELFIIRYEDTLLYDSLDGGFMAHLRDLR